MLQNEVRVVVTNTHSCLPERPKDYILKRVQCVRYFLIIFAISLLTVTVSTPTNAWRLHARATATYGVNPQTCDDKRYHIGCQKRTAECITHAGPYFSEFGSTGWAHASYHKGCKRHLEIDTWGNATGHAHHAPHSTSVCMKGSIEDHYVRQGVDHIDEKDNDEVPAKRELKAVIPRIPPPVDAEGNLSYASMTLDEAEKGVKVNFYSGSRLQLDGRNLREGQISIAVMRVCVANEDGTMLNDGTVELLIDESGQRLRKTGIFQELPLRARAHPTYKNVWNVDLTEANVTVEGVKSADDVEVLLEGATALD